MPEDLTNIPDENLIEEITRRDAAKNRQDISDKIHLLSRRAIQGRVTKAMVDFWPKRNDHSTLHQVFIFTTDVNEDEADRLDNPVPVGCVRHAD